VNFAINGQKKDPNDLGARKPRYDVVSEADMTTATEGAELTQVGPGTVMGQLMRESWIPAVLSSELERD
jgi:hypothetical protein